MKRYFFPIVLYQRLIKCNDIQVEDLLQKQKG